MLAQNNNSFENSASLQEYEDRFHKMMFPVEERTIPSRRNYLATEDIKGASPDSIGSRIK